MALVNVVVNGRSYTVACDDGEEERLNDLAAIVDTKAREVFKSVGQVGDTRLLLMAALLMADEHSAAVASLGAISLGVGSAFAQSYSHAAPPPDNQVQTDR